MVCEANIFGDHDHEGEGGRNGVVELMIVVLITRLASDSATAAAPLLILQET